MTYGYWQHWEIRHILAEILYKGSSRVTARVLQPWRRKNEDDDSRNDVSMVEMMVHLRVFDGI